MADDRPFYAPDRLPPVPRQSRRGELLFEFLAGHHRIRCELLDHGDLGIEVQFWRNKEFEWSRRFDPRLDPTRTPRDLAIAWAHEERTAIEAARRDPRGVIAACSGMFRSVRHGTLILQHPW